MTSLVWIFGRQGERLCEFEANCRRAWKINDIGSATLDVSLRDPKATLDNMRFGNYLYVQHDKLPAWGGVIYTPRDWGYGRVTINAYSMGEMLKHRLSPKTYVDTCPPGEHFGNILRWANAIEDTRITGGEIDESGKHLSMEFHLTDCYEALKKVVEQCGYEWEIVPELRDNRLVFLANFRERLGIVRSMRLIEDKNLRLESSSLMIEQGDIVNHAVSFGSGGSWDSKPVEEFYGEESRSEYGLFEKAISVSGGNASLALENARTEVMKSGYPRRTFRLNAVNAYDGDDTFANLRLGDIVGLDLASVGFTPGGFGIRTNVRVLGMQFDDISGIAELVVDEVRND